MDNTELNQIEKSQLSVLALLDEYIVSNYIKKYTPFEENPIKSIVESYIINNLKNINEKILQAYDNDYNKILEFLTINAPNISIKN